MATFVCTHLILVLTTLTINLSWAAYDLDEKFVVLEQKLDFLIAQVANGSVAPVAPVAPPSTSGSSGISSLESWITPLEVWREPDGDNSTFTIKFKARGSGLVQWWDLGAGIEVTMPTKNISGSSEVQEVTYVKQASTSLQIMAHLGVLATFQSSEQSPSSADLIMQLKNSAETREMTSAITLPTFGIEPLGDFVYDEGKNMTVKLRVPPTDRNGHFERGTIDCKVYLVDEKNWVVRQYNEPLRDMYKVLEIINKTDETLLTVKINTAKYATSGFIDFTIGNNMDQSEDALVHRVSLSKQIVLRPSSQAGPLPDGFLGFPVDPYAQIENGVIKHECSAEVSSCSISCQAIGLDIVYFKITKVNPDGSRTSMDAMSSDESYLQGYGSVKRLTFPPKITGTETFECRVENAHGLVTIRAFEVRYFTPVDILEDQSEVRVLKENDTSNIRHLAFVCTAKGYPAPNVTFVIERYMSYDHNVAPDELEIDGDVITATKFITYDISDPNGLRGEYKGRVSWAACYARYSDEDNSSWAYDDYQFALPLMT